MRAIIFQPARSAMQSGTANSKKWKLEFIPKSPSGIDPIMGWISEEDMQPSQVKLSFNSLDEAVQYAKKAGLAYEIHGPEEKRALLPKSYNANFK